MLTSQVQNKVANPKVTQRVTAPAAKTLPSPELKSGLQDNEQGQVFQLMKDTSKQNRSIDGIPAIQGKFSQGVKQLKSSPSFPVIQLNTWKQVNGKWIKEDAGGKQIGAKPISDSVSNTLINNNTSNESSKSVTEHTKSIDKKLPEDKEINSTETKSSEYINAIDYLEGDKIDRDAKVDPENKSTVNPLATDEVMQGNEEDTSVHNSFKIFKEHKEQTYINTYQTIYNDVEWQQIEHPKNLADKLVKEGEVVGKDKEGNSIIKNEASKSEKKSNIKDQKGSQLNNLKKVKKSFKEFEKSLKTLFKGGEDKEAEKKKEKAAKNAAKNVAPKEQEEEDDNTLLGKAKNLTKEAVGPQVTDNVKELSASKNIILSELVLDGIKSFFSNALGIFKTMKDIVSEVMKVNKKEKKLDKTEYAILLKEAAVLTNKGLNLAIKIRDKYDVSVAPGITTAIPGIGLVINTAQIVINICNGFNAKSEIKQMQEMEEAEFTNNEQITEMKQNEKIFFNDKRGAFLNSKNYQKVNPDFLQKLEEKNNRVNDKKEYLNEIKSSFAIDLDYNEIDKLNNNLKEYSLNIKMQEINYKRKIHANVYLPTYLILLGGNISELIPGGIIVGSIFKATGSIAKLALNSSVALNKMIKNQNGFDGGGTAESTEGTFFGDIAGDGKLARGISALASESPVKHAEYVKHTKQIINMYSKLDTGETFPKQFDRVNSLVKAAGANPEYIHTTALKPNKKYSTVKKLVTAMKSGR